MNPYTRPSTTLRLLPQAIAWLSGSVLLMVGAAGASSPGVKAVMVAISLIVLAVGLITFAGFIYARVREEVEIWRRSGNKAPEGKDWYAAG